jgi:hypothetical protein
VAADSEFNDFEIQIGIKFGTDVAEVAREARKFYESLGQIDDSFIKDRKQANSKAASDELRDRKSANKKYTDAEKELAKNNQQVLAAFLRDRAQDKRKADYLELKEKDKATKKLVAAQKAADAQALQDRRNTQSSAQKILAAGLRKSGEDQRAANQARLQVLASSLRKEESDRRAANAKAAQTARNASASQQKILAAGLRKSFEDHQTANRARLQDQASTLRREESNLKAAASRDRTILAAGLRQQGDERKAANSQTLQAARQAHERQAQAQKQFDRLDFTAAQGAEARRIARAKAFYRALGQVTQAGLRTSGDIVRSGLRTTENAFKSYFARREARQRESGNKVTNIEKVELNQQNNLIHQELNQQNIFINQELNQRNVIYSRAAQKRLATIERTSAQETTVIRKSAVKQAEAQAEIQRRSSTGLLGGATRTTGIGGGGIAALVTGGALYGIKTLIDSASDLNEAQNKVNVVFGKSRGVINDWAATSATAFGMSKAAALEAVSTFGALFSSAGIASDRSSEMSKSLIQIAADLASFYNKRPEDAIRALTSGITGQNRPLKAYGVLIDQTSLKAEALSEGLIKATGSQAKITAAQIAAEKAQANIVIQTKKHGAASIEARDAVAKYGVANEKLGKELGGKLPQNLTAAQKEQAAYGLILKQTKVAQGDFARTSGDVANATRIARAQFTDLKTELGQGFLPVTKSALGVLRVGIFPALQGGAKIISTFTRNLFSGRGGWKVVRDGLTGVAVGLGAVLAVRAGVEVLGLLGSGLSLIAANPAILALAVIGAGIGIIAKNTNLLAPKADAVKRFFTSLAEGSKVVGKAGFDMDHVIVGLSNVVLIQSAFGVAARDIRQGMEGIRAGVDQLREGKGIDGLRHALKVTLVAMEKDLSPAKAQILKGVKGIVVGVRDFISNEALPILSGAKLNLGSFLIGALVPGGDGGVVSRGIHSAITKVLIGAVKGKERDKNEAAVAMGERANQIVTDGFAKVKSTGINIGRFFASLFTGSVGDNTTAERIGYTVRRLIEAGISKVGDFVAPLGRILSSAAGAVGGLFTKYVLPKVIEIPRIIGKFLSRTAFSEQFLKVVGGTAAVIAGAAVVIAAQFVRGFIEGIISRRGDIAKVLIGVVSFALHALIGSGNPFLILGAAVAAGIAGAKVISAFAGLATKFGELKINARASALAIKGDFAGARTEIEKLRSTDVTKIGSRGAGSGLPQLGKQAEDLYVKAGVRFSEFKDKAVAGTAGIGRAFRDLPASLAIAAEQLPAPVQRALQTVVEASKQTATQYGAAFSVAKDHITEGFSKVKDAGKSALTYLKENVSASGAVIGATTGLISGYMTGLANTAQEKAIGTVTSISTIAGAFALGGPIVGGVTAVATAIGTIYGEAQRRSKAAKAEIAKDAAFVRSISKDTQSSLRDIFRSQGGATDGGGRAAAVASLLAKDIDENKPQIKSFFKDLNGNLHDTVAAARGGSDALKRYGNSLVNSKVREIIKGDSDAIKSYKKEVQDAAIAASQNSAAGFGGSLNQRIRRGADREDIRSLLDYNKALLDGKIPFDKYIDGLKRLGATKAEVTQITKQYNDVLKNGIESTGGAAFITSLAGDLRRASALQSAFAQAQAEATRLDELTKPIAERYESAYGRIKTSIDNAKQAYLDFIHAQDHTAQTKDQTLITLSSDADAFRNQLVHPAQGESPQVSKAKRNELIRQGVDDTAGQVAEIAKAAKSLPDAQAKVHAFFEDLRASTKDPKIKDYFTQVEKGINPTVIQRGFQETHQAIKTVGELKQKFTDLITLNKDNPIGIDLKKSRTFDETKKLVTEDLHRLAKSDPTVAAYIKKNGGFNAVRDSIINDATLIDKLSPHISVTMGIASNAATTLTDSVQSALNKIIFTVNVKPTVATPLNGVEGAFSNVLNGLFGRWGGVHSFANGGFTQAHIQHRQRIKYAEPETGGELFMPRRGNRARNDAIMAVGAAWNGGRYITAKELAKMPALAMRDGGTINMATGGAHHQGSIYQPYIPPQFRPHPHDTRAQARARVKRYEEWLRRQDWRHHMPAHHPGGDIGGAIGMAAGGITRYRNGGFSEDEFIHAWRTLARANPEAAIGMGGRRAEDGSIVNPWFFSNISTSERHRKEAEWMEAVTRFFAAGLNMRDGGTINMAQGGITSFRNGGFSEDEFDRAFFGAGTDTPKHPAKPDINHARLYSQAKERVLHEDARHRKMGPKEYARWSEALGRLFRGESGAHTVAAKPISGRPDPRPQIKDTSAIPTESSAYAAAPVTNYVTNNTINQTNNIVESNSPQGTAMEVTRGTKAAVFRTGATLVGSGR